MVSYTSCSDTNREILGNVWISDFQHKPQNDKDKEVGGNYPNAKTSTNYEDEFMLDDLENLIKVKDGENNIQFKLSVNKPNVDQSNDSSLL